MVRVRVACIKFDSNPFSKSLVHWNRRIQWSNWKIDLKTIDRNSPNERGHQTSKKLFKDIRCLKFNQKNYFKNNGLQIWSVQTSLSRTQKKMKIKKMISKLLKIVGKDVLLKNLQKKNHQFSLSKLCWRMASW